MWFGRSFWKFEDDGSIHQQSPQIDPLAMCQTAGIETNKANKERRL